MAVVSRRATWPVLGVSGLLALLFLFAGTTKLIGMQMHVEHFAKWGCPDWFRLVVGAVEVAGAVLLLVPQTAFYAACVLSVQMLGAAYTHLVNYEAASAPFPLVVFALLAFIAYSRRRIMIHES